MISNLVLTGMYNIGVKDEKYMLNGEKTSIKDVPFIRYRFEKYSEDEVNYIKSMQNKFKYSVNLAEVSLCEATNQTITYIKNSIERIAVYLYINITDKEVSNGFDASVIEELRSIDSSNIDRIMFKDNSTLLDAITLTRLKKAIMPITGFKEHQIGVCSSPLSFYGEACLTAVQARDLIALYSITDECKIPSANHECMNTCGCIRHTIISCDIAAPIGKANSGATKKSGKSTGGNKSKTLKKVSRAPMEWI